MQPFNFKIAQMLEYQHVFSGAPRPIEEYIQRIGKEKVLVMIDIDTLVLTCSRLQSRRFILEHWIEVYDRQMLTNEYELNQLPFTRFVSSALLAPGNDMEFIVRDIKVLVNDN